MLEHYLVVQRVVNGYIPTTPLGLDQTSATPVTDGIKLEIDKTRTLVIKYPDHQGKATLRLTDHFCLRHPRFKEPPRVRMLVDIEMSFISKEPVYPFRLLGKRSYWELNPNDDLEGETDDGPALLETTTQKPKKVQRCRRCGEPRKGHNGPTGRGV